jgi:hypothetical protein
MLGKDRYHTSFASNLTEPTSSATMIWDFDASSGNTASHVGDVFRSDLISAPCNNGGDYFKLYLGDGVGAYGFWPCSGGTETWAHFNTGFNGLTFTEMEFNGNPACGTFEQCSASALSVSKVILRADDWAPTGSVKNAVVSADGDIYFGASDGSSYRLVKLNKNGVKQWEYNTNVSIGTPAVLADETVYFGRIGAGGVLAFTALKSDGSKKWDYNDAGSVSSLSVSSKGEPHFSYNSGAQDKLIVLKSDGSIKATINSIGLSGFSPVILEDGTIITSKYVSGNQLFNAYSADGTQLWPEELVYTGTNGNTLSNPSYDQSTGKTYSAAGSKLFEIPSGGSVLNTHQIDSFGIASTMVAISSISSTLYVGFNDINPASGSRLFAINKSDLTKKWATPFSADSRINKQLAVDRNDNVYFSTEAGTLYSVNANGNQNWKIETGVSSGISPILVENGLIWGYGNKLTGITLK